MPKKSAIAIAASVVGLVLASSIAVAMNLGIMNVDSAGPDESVATETTETTEAGAPLLDDTAAAPAPVEPEIITIVINEPLPAVPAPTSTTSAAAAFAGRAGVVLPAVAVAPAEPTAAPVPDVTYPIFDVGDAGEVALEFSAGSISFWGAYPNAGWDFVVEDNGPTKVEVEFRSGAMEIEFTAILEGDQIRIDIKIELEDDDRDDDRDDDDRDDDRDRDRDDDDDDDDDRDRDRDRDRDDDDDDGDDDDDDDDD